MTILSIHAIRPVEFANVIERVPAGMLIVAATVRQQLQFQAKSTQALDAPGHGHRGARVGLRNQLHVVDRDGVVRVLRKHDPVEGQRAGWVVLVRAPGCRRSFRRRCWDSRSGLSPRRRATRPPPQSPGSRMAPASANDAGVCDAPAGCIRPAPTTGRSRSPRSPPMRWVGRDAAAGVADSPVDNGATDCASVEPATIPRLRLVRSPSAAVVAPRRGRHRTAIGGRTAPRQWHRGRSVPPSRRPGPAGDSRTRRARPAARSSSRQRSIVPGVIRDHARSGADQADRGPSSVTIDSPGSGHGAITGMIIVTELSGVIRCRTRPGHTDSSAGPSTATSSNPDCDELLTL